MDTNQPNMLEELENLLLGDGKESKKKVEPSQIDQDGNGAILDALKLQMPQLMDTSALKGLPAGLRYKLLEAHVNSTKEVGVVKPIHQSPSVGSKNGSAQNGKTPLLKCKSRRSSIGVLKKFTENRKKTINLCNISEKRLAFRIFPADEGIAMQFTVADGFIKPNEEIKISIYYKKNQNKVYAEHEPSRENYITNCFKNIDNIRIKSIDL